MGGTTSGRPVSFRSHFILCKCQPEREHEKYLSAVFRVAGTYIIYSTSSRVWREKSEICVSSNIFACFIMGILEKIAEIESEVFILCLIYKSSLI